MMRLRAATTIVSTFAAAALMAGCGNKPVVGVLLPTTGGQSGYGESLESGLRLAYTDARSRNMLPDGFEVVWADSASQPARAVEETRRLVAERNISMLIGGATSNEARALLPLLDELNLICLSPSASTPSLTRDSKRFYRLFPSDELEGAVAGKFLYDRLNRHKVLLYAGTSDYARGIEPEFVRQYVDNLGGTLVGRVDTDRADWAQRSTALLGSSAPDAVYIVEYADRTVEILRHLGQRGFAGSVVTTSAFYSAGAIERAGELAGGVMFPLASFDLTSEREPVMGFVKRYMATYQRAPDIFAAHGYDAMMVAVHALTIAKPPVTAEIGKALHFGLKDLLGVTGPIAFDDRGDVRHNPVMYIYKYNQVMSFEDYLKRLRREILQQSQRMLDGSR